MTTAAAVIAAIGTCAGVIFAGWWGYETIRQLNPLP